MTLNRNQVALLVLLVVVATAVWVAVRYVEDVFKERERQEDAILEGRPEELTGKPLAPKPPAQPPLERSTTRGTEVIVVLAPPQKGETRPSSSRKAVVIRGNGEFVRLPASAAEPGPVVTGMLDRAAVDELARAVMGKAPATGGDAYSTHVSLASGKVSGGVDREAARKLLEISGKSVNKSAAPDSVQLRTAPADGEATEPWPFPRAAPDGFTTARRLSSDSDRARFRESLLRLLERNAKFSHAGKVWTVEELDLIP